MAELTTARPFALRLSIAVAASFVPIYIASAALQGFALAPIDMLWAALGLLIFALPAGLAAAWVFKRSDAGLILGAQLLTGLGLFAFTFATTYLR